MTSALKSDAAPVDTPHQPPCLVLGIETSCDETAVALVRRDGPGRGEILANVVRSQWAEHSAFGGVVPEIAARAHVECIAPIARQALREAAIPLQRVDLIAATAGPGLIGGLLAGLTFAKAIALGAGKPFIAVNHLEAHALTVGLTDHLVPPYLLLLVSGGHTQTVLIEDVGRYHRLGSTIDDALGEAFDKTAKILNLGYPGGPAVERAAINGNASRFDLPRPLARRPEPNFSFAGLKTAVRRTAQRLAAENAHADNSGTTLQSMAQPSGSNRDPAPNAAPAEARPQGGIAASETSSMAQPSLSEKDISDLCASFEAAVCDTVIDRCQRAFEMAEVLLPGTNLPLVVSGGVAANARLRRALSEFATARGTQALFPPPALCTDNGAMIAWAGAERFAAGHSDAFTFEARARWPLDETATPILGAGRHGPKA
jgi:N6-L-threonylcarbamoyladenine synthase